jgi:hypothetical protein
MALSLDQRALPEQRMRARGKPQLGQRGVRNKHGLTIYGGTAAFACADASRGNAQ